jgi:cytidine deaminase
MSDISNIELIKITVKALNPVEVDGDWIGDVGAALVTENWNIYRGVSVEIGSGTGFCAERTAIAQMFTNNEYKVNKIVAVWNNNPEKDVYVLPPCGACRQFIHSRCKDALDIEVVLGSEKTVKLKELYPYSEWPEKEEGLTQKITEI